MSVGCFSWCRLVTPSQWGFFKKGTTATKSYEVSTVLICEKSLTHGCIQKLLEDQQATVPKALGYNSFKDQVTWTKSDEVMDCNSRPAITLTDIYTQELSVSTRVDIPTVAQHTTTTSTGAGSAKPVISESSPGA